MVRKFFFSVLLASLVLAIWAPLSQADVYRFDFDSDFVLGSGHTGTIHTQEGYTSVLPDRYYNGTNGFGWDSNLGNDGRDRGAIAGDPKSDLLRDLHFSGAAHTFSVTVPNGIYAVTLYFRDTVYTHDNIQVRAEGALMLTDVDVLNTNVTEIRTFTVTVTDGVLNLQFSDNGGGDTNWIISGMEIAPVPLPASALLLGTGLLGLGLLGWRRKKA